MYLGVLDRKCKLYYTYNYGNNTKVKLECEIIPGILGSQSYGNENAEWRIIAEPLLTVFS
jgi:hypothetical protein